MRQSQIVLKLFSVGACILYPGLVAANNLSVSGGIAMPSFATSTMQNAAGVVLTPKTNLELQGGTSSGFSTFRGGLAYGDGTFGITAGADLLSPGNVIDAFYGLGVGLQGLKTLVGFAGTTGLSPAGGSSFNGGMLIYPNNSFNLGFTAMGFTGGFIEWGAGLGIHFGPSFSLVLDTAFSQSFAFLGIQPGLRVGNPNAALTVSYGSGIGSSQLNNNEVTVGGALKIGNGINWELYYNRFATFYTALSFQM